MSVFSLFLTGIITIYPGPNVPDQRIEAITDLGPILEMIVRCPKGTAIISYSKGERLFCGPRMACSFSRETTIRNACAGS